MRQTRTNNCQDDIDSCASVLLNVKLLHRCGEYTEEQFKFFSETLLDEAEVFGLNREEIEKRSVTMYKDFISFKTTTAS